jgi:cytochrome c-type biogenesis protein CcmH
MMRAPLLIFAFAMQICLASPLSAQASGSSFANKQLADPRAEAKASELMKSLRCVQCQGQSIADSDAPIAELMRHEVRQRIAKGESATSIRDWMVGRYGEYISFEPAFSGPSLLLWIAPFLILLIAVFVARTMFRARPE